MHYALMNSSHLADDFRNVPYWWDSAGIEFEAQSGDSPGTLPERAEVAIIGGGYTGLSAALTLARAGRDVVLLDAEMPGYGCSSRNGGLVGPSFHKLGLTGLVARHGVRKAHAILSESMDALEFLYAFIETENIDCGLQRTGRFRGADRPGHYEDMANLREGPETNSEDPDATPSEHPMDHEHEGAVYTCSMHPDVKASAPGRCPECGMKLEKKKMEP